MYTSVHTCRGSCRHTANCQCVSGLLPVFSTTYPHTINTATKDTQIYCCHSFLHRRQDKATSEKRCNYTYILLYYSLQRATLRVGCNQKEHHSGSDLIGTPITPKEHRSGSDSEGAPLGLRLRRSTARALTCEGTTAL